MGKDLRVKGIYGSGMVLQRDKINCIFGTGDVFSDVIMTFRGVTSITQVDENGNWNFEFSPGNAGGPFEMCIKSDSQKIEFSDIYVGEVWLNAGEGNCGIPMDDLRFSYGEEFRLSENKYVRMINVPARYSFGDKIDYVDDPKWMAVSPSTLGAMSGLGYFFGKKLSVDLGVPVGIINVAAPDVPIVSWLSPTALGEMGDKADDLATLEFYENPGNLKKAQGLEDEVLAWNSELSKELPSKDFGASGGWAPCQIPGVISGLDSNGVLWLKKVIDLSMEQVVNFGGNLPYGTGRTARLWLGNISCPDEVFFNGTVVGSTCNPSRARRYDIPANLLKIGKNEILIKLQKNDKSISFVYDKPYCLFSDNVYVAPCLSRNVENRNVSLAPIDGENISLEGDWEMKVGIITNPPPKADNLVAKPSAIYKGVLPSMFKYAMAGVIWYQGIADALAGRQAEYKGLLTKLISLWRRRFTYWSRDLPFVVVQLPAWGGPGATAASEGELAVDSKLSVIRKAQSEVADLVDKVGLAVCVDAGEWNDPYPEKLMTIGNRCEFEALRVAYGKSFISPAPKLAYCDYEADKCTIKFDCGNSSLHTCKVNGFSADLTLDSDGGRIFGFSMLCKVDGVEKLVAADAKLVGPNSVDVYIPSGFSKESIIELRYLWSDCPSPINLYSRDFIPAGPFIIHVK